MGKITFNSLLRVFVCGSTGMHGVLWRSEDNFHELVLSFHVELRSSDLAASIFLCWTIFPVLVCLFFILLTVLFHTSGIFSFLSTLGIFWITLMLSEESRS